MSEIDPFRSLPHSRMKKVNEIPWLRLCAESVAIVASILLAFGIDTWWDERQERREEADIVAGLLSEFRANRALLESSIQNHQNYFDAARQLVEDGIMVDSRNPTQATLVAFRVFHGYETFHPTSGVLDSILAAGKLELLSDDQLRALVASWPRSVAELTEQETVTVDWLGTVHVALASKLDFTVFLPGEALGTESLAELDEASVDFLNTKEARSYAAKRLFWETATLLDAEPLLQLNDEIIRALDDAETES